MYNSDEYGLHKTNLRIGLLPPVSGHYHNWFKDCMGSPIRSEIWACIAPGLPNVAARYAYEDAIVDHAGGESVYGEMFNAALESAAFVVDDRIKLVEIGLSYIPEDCQTAGAVRDALDAFRRGLDWKQARDYVLDRSYSLIAQYSPLNLGFQTIGLLYGEDFGEAICKAVNCGYDTDCTGATVGAVIGIIEGMSGLPEKWTAPLNDKIVTNASWGGIAHLREPKNLDELTRRVCAVGSKVLAVHGACLDDLDHSRLHVDAKTKALWGKSPTTVNFVLGGIQASINYIDDPAISAGDSKRIEVIVKNSRPTTLRGTASVSLQKGWTCSPVSQAVELSPEGEVSIPFTVCVTDPADVCTSNRGSIRLSFDREPCLEEIPLVFVGAHKWLASERMEGDLDTVYDIEKGSYSDGMEEGWHVLLSPDNSVPCEELFEGKPGIVYLRQYVYVDSDIGVRIGFPSTCPFRIWVNGQMIHEARGEGVLRPNYYGDGRSYSTVSLQKGWNHVLIKVVRQHKPVSAHFILATGDRYAHGLVGAIQCRFPWETTLA